MIQLLCSYSLKLLSSIVICLYGSVLFLLGLLVSFHTSIMQALLPQLSSPRLAVRKRSIMAIGNDMWQFLFTTYLYTAEIIR